MLNRFWFNSASQACLEDLRYEALNQAINIINDQLSKIKGRLYILENPVISKTIRPITAPTPAPKLKPKRAPVKRGHHDKP